MITGDMIEAMFEKRELSSEGKEVVAIAFLYETLPAPSVWVGPGPDPYAVGMEDRETRHLRFVLTKVFPSYQPHFIPGHLDIGQFHRHRRIADRMDRQGRDRFANDPCAAAVQDYLQTPQQSSSRCRMNSSE